ncbi:MAG: DNA polymerase I [Planctomycetota bacterium]
MKTFYLIDGHAQIFRAYYAPFGAQLNSPDGEPTKATYIFTQMMLGILEKRKPDYLAVALDHGDSSTERRDFYPEYKANRDSAPEDFGPQVRRIEELLGIMSIPTFKVKGQEADDIIATIGRLLEEEEIELRIVSKDKDLHQLLTHKVKMWDPQKDFITDPVNLLEDKGYTPEQAVEIQTLTGDSTDNIPGVPGIGPKKAVALIHKYGSVEGVREHVDELTPKMSENIANQGDLFDLTRRLVTLNREVDFEFDLDACRTDKVTLKKLKPRFEELGFRRLLSRLDDPAEASEEEVVRESVSGDYRLVNTESDLESFLAELKEIDFFAIDTETTSVHAVDCELVGLSFSWEEGKGWYLALRSNKGDTLDPDAALEALKPILEDPAIGKCGQNIKYDLIVLRQAGIELQGVAFDTMIASYLLAPERRTQAMDALARDLLGLQTIPISDLIGKGKKQVTMLEVELDKVAEYAGEDADVTWRLYEFLAPKLESEGLRKLFDELEMPLLSVLADMENEGVALDLERLEETRVSLTAKVDELKSEIHRAAGREFNIDSPKQLSEILFDEMNLRVVKKTKTGRSTDASVLEILAAETVHPLPGLILKYRAVNKLLGTYVAPLPEMISEKTGRVHASFHQAVAATGRLSSSDPNLQNIPVRTEQGRKIREAFVPGSPGRVLITADYSQIELRVLAHLSEDKGLREAFNTDQDIHTFVAAQLEGIEQDRVTREQRSRAKAVNFGIIYGQGAFGLARGLGITRAEAAKFIDEYKERYPGITEFMETCVSEAEENGFVTTMLGRRRTISEIHSNNRNLRALGERLAINTVVQGSAADMIKRAMVNLHERIDREELDMRLLIQVHDELVLDAPLEKVEEYSEIVRQEMAGAIELAVPVKVDVAWGKNWLESK